MLLVLLPFILKPGLQKMAREQIGDLPGAGVEWSELSISFIRGFPDLSIHLSQVSVLVNDSSGNDTLARIGEVELRMNPFVAFTGEMEVRTILLTDPDFRGTVNEDGTGNWEVFREAVNGNEDSGEAPASVDGSMGGAKDLPLVTSLKKLVVRGGKLQFTNERSDFSASAAEIEAAFTRQRRGEGDLVSMELVMRHLDAASAGIKVMNNGSFKLDLEAESEADSEAYTIAGSKILLNGLLLETTGRFSLDSSGDVQLDLLYRSPETSFGTLLSLVPPLYLKDFESLQADGEFQVEGRVQGGITDSLLPDAYLAVEVHDGSFSYPGLTKNASDIQLSLKAAYRGNDLDSSWLDLERLHMKLGDDQLEFKCRITHPRSDPTLAGMAAGTVDFGSLADIVPLDRELINGRMDADLRWDLRLSSLEKELFDEVKLDGTLSLSDYTVEWTTLPSPVELHRMDIRMDPKRTELTALDLRYGASDLRATGFADHLVPYLFKRKTLEGSVDVKAGFLDIASFIPADSARKDTPEPARYVPAPVRFRIPEAMDVGITVSADRIRLPRVRGEQLRGTVVFRKGQGVIRDLSLQMLEGRVTLSGTAVRSGEYLDVQADVSVDGIDIPAAYRQLASVRQLAPMAGYGKGKANLDMEYRSLVDNNFVPLYGTMEASGLIHTKDLEIRNVDMMQVNRMVTNEKMREMAPGDVEIGFYVKNGRIGIEPVTLDFDGSRITVSGSHGIDQSLDYTVDLRIAKSDLGDAASTMVNGLSLLAAATGRRVAQSDHVLVKAVISGTFEKPRVKTDLSGNLLPRNGSGGNP